METNGGRMSDDTERAAALVEALLGRVRSSGMRMSTLATQVGLPRSTVFRWEAGAIPRIFHAQLLGAAAGLRMEWAPLDPSWPGADRALREERPAELPIMGPAPGRSAHHHNPVSNHLQLALFDAYLLGAEVRWARIYMKLWALDECPGDRHAWARFENGPVVSMPDGSSDKHRRYLSSPLPTATFIGRTLGLELVWRKRSEPYRVRPWELEGPPPADTHTAALRLERSRRPRLL